MENTTRKAVRGIKIRNMNFIMILISCILYLMLLFATFHASRQYKSMIRATEEYITCEDYAVLVTSASDYLTEKVRLYTVTADPVHVQDYFTEIHVNRGRDRALESLQTYHVDDEIYGYLQAALDHSNRLMEKEIYAMKLIAAARGADLSGFPEEIQKKILPPDDLHLSSEQMTAKAQELVFGSAYQDSKELISSNVRHFLDSIVDETEAKLFASAGSLKHTMHNQQLLISILFVENIITFILIICLIIKPLQIYIKNIKDSKMLEISGSYEFKYLALTYNNIYELNTANEAILRYQAEHDPLTGIINRGAFDQLRELLKLNPSPMALLIIDVDQFKQVNDGYGHETGDSVLKKVAKLLEEGFRSTDFPARIGGDEFAVIVTDAAPEIEPLILDKINSINHTLMNPADHLPKVSVSVGGAFSEKGFTDDLYQKADSALYQVKENGRCGCRFYKES